MKPSDFCKCLINLFQNKKNDIPEIQVTEKGILKLLHSFNISKAAGPNGFRPRVIVLGTSPYAYFAFSGISAPTIPHPQLDACQCEPYLQGRRQDQPILLYTSVLDLHVFYVSSYSILSVQSQLTSEQEHHSISFTTWFLGKT